MRGMQGWATMTVATVPITVRGALLHVALDVGVRAEDIDLLHDGTAGTEGDFIVYDGPPCPFALAYRVRETGEGRQVGLGDKVFAPRHHVMIQIKPPRP